MSAAQAIAFLGLPAGASPAEVRRRYQELSRDAQMRLRNAPTPSLKRACQEDLQALEKACQILEGTRD
jgi:hypothetical protein